MSTRDDIIRILKDPSLVTVTALTQYVEAQRADERDAARAEVADLRAKVKRIPKVDQTWAGSELILRTDVLALLPEEVPE